MQVGSLGLSEEMILEPRPEWQEGTGHGKISIIGVHSQLLAGILKGALLLSGPSSGLAALWFSLDTGLLKNLPRGLECAARNENHRSERRPSRPFALGLLLVSSLVDVPSGLELA